MLNVFLKREGKYNRCFSQLQFRIVTDTALILFYNVIIKTPINVHKQGTF